MSERGLRITFAIIQVVAMSVLAFLFLKNHNFRLAGVQFLYCVATIILFAR